MPEIVENLRLACAICRIGVYSICRRLCCKASPPPPRPEFSLLCLGLTGAGKTTLLTGLAGESLEDLQPTTGFLIKCCQLNSCILNVKEVGGGPKVRQFWRNYYSGIQGLVFVVDSSTSADELEEASSAFHEVLEDPILAKVPCLVLANCQDKPKARSEKEIIEALDCEILCQDRNWAVHTCTVKDIEKLREGIQDKYIKYLLTPPDDTADEKLNAGKENPTCDSNRV